MGISGIIIGIVAFIAILIVTWCVIRYLKNSLYSFSDHIWFLGVKLNEIEPLLAENGLGNGQVETPTSSSTPIELKDIEAVLRDKLPRYSVVYNGQSVDVFADVRMSQVYCIAQDYFQTSSNTPNTSSVEAKSNIAVESMDVYPIASPREDRSPCQRPQSILYEEDQDLPIVDAGGARQTFPGMYMSKNIGPDGGSISIQGAKLTVPLGALSVSTPIRLGVVWKPNGAPPLDSQQALLSSVVACEPHGLQFDVPVNLEIQHCAQMRKEWELCIMRSNTSVREGEFCVYY